MDNFKKFEEFVDEHLPKCNDLIRKLDSIKKLFSLLELLRQDCKNKIESFNPKTEKLKCEINNYIGELNRKEFKIGVIGREKAGKSSLINAWINADLLPTAQTRCTYTTTEIRSCTNENEQKVVIEYFSREEFAANKQEIEKILSQSVRGSVDHNLLTREVEEIDHYENEINGFLGRDIFEQRFTDFNEVRDRIRNAISNPGEARAVKRIQLWTTHLSTRSMVTLFDVPGYDSPMVLHKIQTRERCKVVDAVIFVKDFTAPSLVDCEHEMINIINEVNIGVISINQRLFVALNRCDNAVIRERYEEALQYSRDEWRKNGFNEALLNERLFSIASGSHINESEAVRNEITNRLRNIGITDDQLNDLRTKVNNYIVHERRELLRNTFEGYIEQLRGLFNEINNYSREIMPNTENEEDFKQVLNDRRMSDLNEFWATEWRRIDIDLAQYFIQNVHSDSSSSLRNRHNLYRQFSRLVENFQNNATTHNNQFARGLFDRVLASGGIINFHQADIEIRQDLYNNMFRDIRNIFKNLGQSIWNSMNEVIDWMHRRLFRIDGLREGITREEFGRLSQELILRFVQPALHLFIRNPRSDRNGSLQRYMEHILILGITDYLCFNSNLIYMKN